MTQDPNPRRTPTRDDDETRARDAGTDRSIADWPVDPNSLPARVNIPPGVKPEDVRDPGHQTSGAPPVDNRSGESPDEKDER